LFIDFYIQLYEEIFADLKHISQLFTTTQPKQVSYRGFPQIPSPPLKGEGLSLSTTVTWCDPYPYKNRNWPTTESAVVLPLVGISA